MKWRLWLFLILVVVLLRPARADLEGIARLSFDAEESGQSWIEGFGRIVDGQPLVYPSHRDPQANGRIVRAMGMSMNWVTAPAPSPVGAGPLTFLWVASMADQGSHEEFELSINDAHKIRFRISNGWGWTVKGEEGGALTFAADQRNGSQDLFGYMKLTIPAGWAKAGEAVALRISAADVKSKQWVQIYEYADSVAEFRSHLPRNVFVEYLSAGEHAGAIKVICPLKLAGKKAAVRAGAVDLGEVEFKAESETAGAFVDLPAATLREPRAKISVQIDGKPIGEAEMLPLARYRLRAFLDEPLELESYILTPGQTPVARWMRPEMVRANMGEFPLTTTLYDSEMNPVEKTSKLGRYGVVVSAQTPDGFSLRRYFTVFCAASQLSWRDQVELTAKLPAKFGIEAGTVTANQAGVDTEMGDLVRRQAGRDAAFAAALAGWYELQSLGALPVEERLVQSRDRQWWVNFKRRQSGADKLYGPLQLPQKTATPTTTLHEGDPQSVGYSAGQLANIDRVATEWGRQGKEPLAVLVARQGVIVFQKAYGRTADGKDMTLQTACPLASTAKMLTAMIAMQCVDQKFLTLDDPVKKFLPELDRGVPTDITLRHLLTHTAGFDSYGEWGVDENHAFENCVGQFAPCLDTGKIFYYSGNDYALVGKLLECITGECVPYLFRDHLFAPLGCDHSSARACDGGCDSTPEDLARIGQVMLNKGAYGNLRFFSEENYEKMLPASLEKTVGIKMDYGLSVSPMYKEMLGFGGSSGTSVRWWPEKQLVIAVCRLRIDPTHADNITRLVDAIIEPFAPATRPAKP